MQGHIADLLNLFVWFLISGEKNLLQSNVDKNVRWEYFHIGCVMFLILNPIFFSSIRHGGRKRKSAFQYKSKKTPVCYF